jgi:XrtN system VIT domain protein
MIQSQSKTENENEKLSLPKADNFQNQYINYWLLPVSAIVGILFYVLNKEKSSSNLASFFVIYVLCIINLMGYFIYRNESTTLLKLKQRLVCWSLLIVSCFALNKEVTIFYESTNWLSWVICGSIINNIAYALLPVNTNKFITTVNISLLTISFFLWLYFSIYLLPVLPIGLFGMLALGIGIHAFIPLFLTIALAKVLYLNWTAHYKVIVITALVLFCTLSIYLSKYKIAVDKIDKIETEFLKLENENSSPQWFEYAKRLDNDWITNTVIKSDFILQSYQGTDFFDFSLSYNFKDLKKHDPLALIASIFIKQNSIPNDIKIKILESKMDFSHETEERLWSGENLSVDKIITQTKIYSASRIAYTEKILTIKNNGNRSNWNTNEGIFTFYLPEGAAVTSLSLWINDKEEKGVLTTKSKALKAYKTIVGVEQRDPSIVQWKEGNMVILRVFPCNAFYNRIVKIGFTSPLTFNPATNELEYQNIHFKGPSINNTIEDITIEFDQQIKNINSDLAFTMADKNTKAKYSGAYSPDWKLNILAPKFTPSAFSFKNKTYQLEQYQPIIEACSFSDVYLDIDKSWEKQEVLNIINWSKGKTVWVWENGFKKINATNIDNIYKKLSSYTFGCIPVFQIKNPETALLIAKGDINTPTLAEFKSLKIYQKPEKFNLTIPIKTVFLGNKPTNYLKALDELRIIQLVNSDWDSLKDFLQKNQFQKYIENEQTFLLKNAQLIIKETNSTDKNKNKTDHLLCLFAYNKLMSKIGRTYFENKNYEQELIDIAALGNVVSPISSLIVLETAEDYKRFDINKNNNGLENASFNNSGAVPEPHEWALIIIAILISTYLIFKKKYDLNVR